MGILLAAGRQHLGRILASCWQPDVHMKVFIVVFQAKVCFASVGIIDSISISILHGASIITIVIVVITIVRHRFTVPRLLSRLL